MLEPDFFSRYDALAAQSQSLLGVEGALQAAKASLHQAQTDLHQKEQELSKNIEYAQEQRDRIALISEHWFFGNTVLQPQLWLRGGTDGKIERAKTKLARCEEEKPGIEVAIEQLQQVTIPPLQAEASRLAAASNSKAAADQERSSMRERAVTAHPSFALQQLLATATGLNQAVAFEQTNAGVLHEVGNLCRQAAEQYERALRDCRQANQANNMALAEHSRAEGHGPHGHHHQHHHGQHHGHGQHHAAQAMANRRESFDQSRRDRMMEQAARDADRAADLLTRAFGMVPAAVRERYPSQCAQIGHVQVPRLAQTHFGDRMMEFFGGGAELLAEFRSGDKIRQNMALIQQCRAVASAQQATVHALEQQVRRDADEARRQLQATEHAIDGEKDQILATLRTNSAIGGAPPQAMPAMPAAVPIGLPVGAAPAAPAMATAAPAMATVAPPMATAIPPMATAAPANLVAMPQSPQELEKQQRDLQQQMLAMQQQMAALQTQTQTQQAQQAYPSAPPPPAV